MARFWQSYLNVRRDEVAPLLASALFFFCVLTAIMSLRPVRDSLGTAGGTDIVRWLFVGTAVVTLAVNPIFGWLVSRFRRVTFITATYTFFALSLVCFYLLLTLAPETVGETSGRVYYVWHSVMNLFCTAVFWALMADRFTFEQSKRLFGAIAVGGTLGAIAGPSMAGQLVTSLGTPALLLVSAGFLLAAVGAAWLVCWLRPAQTSEVSVRADEESGVIGGNAWAGLAAVFRSRYLLAISLYILCTSVTMTYLYFTRIQMVNELGGDTNERTKVFANLDLITQLVTLGLQLVVSGHLMKRFGVGAALIVMPAVISLGFIGLAVIGSFAALVVFEATFRAVRYAIAVPAQQTLFTVVSREDKYKAKSFTDTFVIRGGDLLGAWTEGLLVDKLGPQLASWGLGLTASLAALASVALPLAAIWAGLSLWLDRKQVALANALPPPKNEAAAGALKG